MASRDEIIRFVFEVTGSSEIAAAVKVMLEAGDAGDVANEQIRGFVDELNKLSDASKSIQAFVSTKAGLAEVTDQLTQAQSGFAALSKEFDHADASSRAVNKAYAAAEKAVADLTAQQRALQVEFAKAQGALQKAGIDTGNLAQANQDLRDKAGGVAEQIAAASKEAQKSGKNLRDAGDGAKHLGDEAKKSGTLLGELRDNLGKIVAVAGAAAGALKAIEFGANSFKEAANLEETLVRVHALAGEAQQSLAGFEAGIDDAASQAGVSANMAAAGMAALVAQGRSADEALQALVPTLLLAKTAQIDVAQAAALVDGALSQFGGTAADAAKYVDILVTASKGSKDGIAGLADGIQKLAPFARELNLSFKDTVGILGFMTRNGLSAADATKGLASIFRDLKDPASNLRQELFALGDGTGDFDKAITTLASSGERGKKALLGLDDSTRKVVLFIQQQGVQGLAQFRTQLDNVNGAAAELDKAIGDTLNGAWGDFTRAIDTIGAQLAKPVLEPLKVELQQLALRLNEFAKSPAFDELQRQIGDLARNGVEALDHLLKGIDWSAFVAGARAALADTSETIASFKDNLKGVADAINVVSGVLGVLYRTFLVVFDGAKILISGAVAASAELGSVIGQTIDKIKGSESAYTRAMESIRDAAIDASKNGVEALAKNGDLLLRNLSEIARVGDSAGSGLAALGAIASRVHASFSNVAAGVDSTRKALQRFDVPPGTFANVIGGAEQAGKAMADLAKRTEDAQREANTAQANFDRLARSSQSNTQELQRAAAALDQANAKLHALKDAAAAAATAAAGADGLEAALKRLGVTLQKDLAESAKDDGAALDAVFKAFLSGKAAIEDVRAAFETYSARQLDSVKNSDSWKQQQVRDALEVKRAILGLSEVKPSPDFSHAADGARSLEQQAQRAGDAVEAVGNKGSEAAREISDGFAQLAGIYTGWTSKFEETSHSAALRFQELTKSISEFGVSLNPLVEADVIGLARLGDAISRASAQTKAEIEEQKARVAELTAQYQNMSASALAAQATLAGGAEALAKSFEAQAAAARNGESQLSLLGASDLSPLASALESVAAKTRQIANEALSARQQFAAMANDIRQQIAQQQGDDAKAENLRFQAQLEQLRQQAQEKGVLNSREYADLVAEATRLHKLKMDQIKEQAAAAKKAADDAAARAAAAAKEEQSRGTEPAAPAVPQPAVPTKTQLEVTLNGTQLGSINPGDSAAIERLARALLPEMMRQIRAAAANIPQGFRPGGPVR